MFGLTKREQRWAAEQKAAELLVTLTVEIVKASQAQELAELRIELAELRAYLSKDKHD